MMILMMYIPSLRLKDDYSITHMYAYNIPGLGLAITMILIMKLVI